MPCRSLRFKATLFGCLPDPFFAVMENIDVAGESRRVQVQRASRNVALGVRVPGQKSENFLHPIDFATNKVAAAYGRREPRDVVALVTIHERTLPLRAVGIHAGRSRQRDSPDGSIYGSRFSSRCQRPAHRSPFNDDASARDS